MAAGDSKARCFMNLPSLQGAALFCVAMKRRNGIGRAEGRQSQSVLALYQVLYERYASNTSLQWQIPLYAIPAQAALFVGIAATSGLLALLLGIVAVTIGLVGAIVMRRIELTARWDRQAMDEFESRLLPGHIGLHLLHDAPFRTRLERRPLRSSQSAAKRFELWLMMKFPPSLTVMLLLIIVGAVAAGVGIERGLSSSSPVDPPFGKPRAVPAGDPVVSERS